MRVKIDNFKSPRSRKPRREAVQVDNWDSCMAYVSLAIVTHEVMEKFRLDVVENGEVPESYLSRHGQDRSAATIAWMANLTAICWSFEQARRNFEDQQAFYAVDEAVPPEDIENKYKVDTQGLESYWKRVDHGFKLYGENFRELMW